MKRLTLTLSDEEFAALERHAADERRTVRDMAAYLVAKHTPALPISSGTLTIRTSGTLWNGNANLGAAAPVPLMAMGNTALEA